MGNNTSSSQSSQGRPSHSQRVQQTPSRRFRAIADQFQSVEQVQAALQKEGLESCNLVIAVDFTKSNEWTGKHSFAGRSLHHLGVTPNPYEEAMMIIGKTLSKFDDDQLIPAYGFGDVTCSDSRVFSFNPGDQPCQGLDAVVWRYRQLAPAVRLAGPTSFAPAIQRACQIVNDSGGQFHILLLIADGQVTRSSDLERHQLSPQESATIDALVAASKLPLAVVMVGVGDGPWDMMKHFDDALPTRDFDNFQFVNFTELMSQYGSNSQRREAQFALRALMEIPEQYKVIQRLGLLGRRAQIPQYPQPLPPPPAAAAPAGFAGPPAAGLMPQGSGSAYPNPFGVQQAQHGTPGFGAPAAAAGGLNPFNPAGSNSIGGGGGANLQSPMPSYPPIGGGFFGPTAANPNAAADSSAGLWGGVAAGGSSGQQQQQHGQQSDPLANPMFMCPITQDVMKEPVIAADGYTYEKVAIQDWLRSSDRSPMTNDKLRHKDLTPNHALRSAIMEAQQAAGGTSRR